MKKSPAAPPVYRPSPQPKVLQRKTATKRATPTVARPVKRGGESIQRAISNPFQMSAIWSGVSVGGPGSLFANPPAPLRGVRVGDAGAGANFLAASNWRDDTAYQRALVVLRELQTSGADFPSVAAIVSHVNSDAQVAAAVAAAAARAAEEARVVGTLTGGVSVRVADIRGGTWRPIPGRSNGDHELLVRIGSTNYSLHVHPPRFNGGAGLPGEVMRSGSETLTQTPQTICDEIVRIHGRPGGW